MRGWSAPLLPVAAFFAARPIMQALAMALAAGGGGDSDEMSERDAAQLCTTLRSMASTICDSLTKRLQSQLGEPGGGDRSLDKSGEQVQAEALQLCCLMTGRGGDAEAGRKLVAELETHAAVPEVAAFLRYWAQLSLMAGVVAPNAGKEVHTAWSDWYRGPPGQARYMPSLPVLRSTRGLEDFVLQANPSPNPDPNPDLTLTLTLTFTLTLTLTLTLTPTLHPHPSPSPSPSPKLRLCAAGVDAAHAAHPARQAGDGAGVVLR